MSRIRTRRGRAIAALAAAVALTAALAGCASGSGSSSDSASPSASAGALPPVIVEIEDLDGTTVEVPLDSEVDLVVAEGDDVTVWVAEIADPTIVEFVPGKDDGSAQFNPGLQPLEVGQTEVVLSDGTSKTVTFTVDVVE
ncbi:hypothetical protein ACWKWP_08230 [Agromyces soli]